MDLSKNIKGKVVVITGASSGLGETTARYLAAKGANVVLGARRVERLESIVNEINAEGSGKAIFVKTDVTNKEEVQALIDKAVSTFDKLDVMVNNAGLMSIAPISELKVDEWDKMIDINIKGVLYGIAAALPVFQKQKSGHFINISSIAGVKVFSPGGTVYSGTKFAVRAISEGLRHEVGGSIRTTTLEPGAIESELKHGTTHKESSEAVNALYSNMAISSDSIARTIAFAIEQPADVDINDIVIRPTVQDF
ncbi:SDR family oxidoreductase [Microscilla marina]|uniref:Short-chain dehydrogenase/reductase SDR n=1 Tax=Microscilla marina ATCC 23134 TaxID=313606 RepID=A1ZQK5_MICM2|nr:SDR family oxidoreductase [Microscilla marina]EAY27377.1 short-chain dehydrogenase/reductase SDR [Microscilla marina ATCC 23134]